MRETSEKGWFWSWGKGMYRFRWYVLAFWLVLFLTLVFLAFRTPELLEDNGFTPTGSPSHEAQLQLQEELDIAPSMLQLVFESKQKLDSAAKESIMALLAPLEERSDVGELTWISATRKVNDPHIAAIQIPLLLQTDEALQVYPDIRSQISAPEGVDVYITGGPAVMYDMQKASKNDIVKAEMIGIPIAMVVLLLIFGTVVAAALPLIVGVMSLTITLGIVYFIAQQMSLSNFLPNIVTMLGLAVGIDYALFMVSRFREELKKQDGLQEAVAMTCQKAGKSIFFSGVAVLIGLIGMLFIDLNIFTSLSLGGSLVVTLSVLLANTLLLSLLAILGPSIDRWNVIPARWRKRDGSLTWRRIGYAVMRRPVVLALLLIGIFVVCMLPLFQAKMVVPAAEVLPPDYESRYGYNLLQEQYDSRELNPILLSVDLGGDYAGEEAVIRMAELQEALRQLDYTKSVTSYLDVLDVENRQSQLAALQLEETKAQLEGASLASGENALVTVIPSVDHDSAEADELVRQIRELEVEDLDVLTTGEAPYRIDIVDRIFDGIPKVLAFVMGVTYLVLMWAFRSLLLPLKAVLMNVLSLGASLGIVVLVFQYGYLADALQVTSTGGLNATLPVIIFCVVFGISMDYEVFLISRIMEEYEQTGDNEMSTVHGLEKTGSLITGAALILIVVVGTFIFTDIEVMKALGLGLTLAVLLDATLIRLTLVPALMKIMGKANWYAPRWLKK